MALQPLLPLLLLLLLLLLRAARCEQREGGTERKRCETAMEATMP